MTHTIQTDIDLVRRVVRGEGVDSPEDRERLAVLVASGLVLPGGVNRVPVEHINTLNTYTVGTLAQATLPARMKRQDPTREKHTRTVAKIIRLIQAAGGEIGHSKLINAVKVSRHEFAKALTDAGVVIEVTQPKRGRPRTTYRLV